MWDVNDGFPKKLNAPRNVDNNAIYIGQYDEYGNRFGRGIYIWHDGAKYIGYWDRNMANGHGRLIHADGDIYEGGWVDDKAHGKGKYHHYAGSFYDGDWEYD